MLDPDAALDLEEYRSSIRSVEDIKRIARLCAILKRDDDRHFRGALDAVFDTTLPVKTWLRRKGAQATL